MYAAITCVVSVMLALLQYPARPPDPPTPTPSPPGLRASPAPVPDLTPTPPGMTPPPKSRMPAAPGPGRPLAPTGTLKGPLAQLNWLLGHWNCSGNVKLYFTSSQGGYALIEQLDSPTARSAGRLTFERGMWVFTGSSATTYGNSPFTLTADALDVGATFLDLKGEFVMPGAMIPTRFVRRQTSPRSFTDTAAVYVGGNWQALPSRSCKRG